jgi:hypothetical protein
VQEGAWPEPDWPQVFAINLNAGPQKYGDKRPKNKH